MRWGWSLDGQEEDTKSEEHKVRFQQGRIPAVVVHHRTEAASTRRAGDLEVQESGGGRRRAS